MYGRTIGFRCVRDGRRKDSGASNMSEHEYILTVRWTGNTGSGTSSYKAYSRDHEILKEGKPPLAGSSDPEFMGDSTKWNPEELLVAAVSNCHMLWYLHLCADAGVIVQDYEDRPHGFLSIGQDGSGNFSRIVLRPEVRITQASSAQLAAELHKKANEKCFIAASLRCIVEHQPTIRA